MQKKQIEHPFHKISFDYDDTKPWTARDEKLLNTYLRLHDSEARRHENARDLMKRYGEHEKHIEEVRKKMKQMKEKLTATRDAADHILAQIQLQVPNALENFVKQMNETNDFIQEYDKEIRKLEAETMDLKKLKDHYHDEEEDSSLWELLTDLKITYGYDKNMAIDYVSFDDDEERFREKASYISRQNDNYMDYCNRVIENYNRLMLETEIQYEVWKEFCRRMVLIEHITGHDSGKTTISIN
ncbi:MAG TPA: hypothetical protein VNJ07_09425 [Chitinophagales bacterium]|nr:hypothetical protein [Chitinophagales bacterium]